MRERLPVSYRELFRFGLPLYPGSLTQHFSVRLDVYLIAAIVPNPAAPLGYYSMAVTMAQLVTFLPAAVSSLFFPHVAGSTRDEADRQVPMLSRVTLLLTAGMAVVLVPAAIILIRLLLPAFEESIAPLVVLLPGVVALSLTEVLSSYVAGVGSAGWTSNVKIGSARHQRDREPDPDPPVRDRGRRAGVADLVHGVGGRVHLAGRAPLASIGRLVLGPPAVGRPLHGHCR